MEPRSSPTALPAAPLAVPAAAIVVMVLAAFLLLVVALLVLRKLLQSRGLDTPSLQCRCQCPQFGEGCKQLAERADFRSPDCQVCLDSVCPSKERCALLCSRLWSCYSCHALADSCRDTAPVCPDCQALQCPDCDCCDTCHCALRVPECSHVTCLCFECGRPEP